MSGKISENREIRGQENETAEILPGFGPELNKFSQKVALLDSARVTLPRGHAHLTVALCHFFEILSNVMDDMFSGAPYLSFRTNLPGIVLRVGHFSVIIYHSGGSVLGYHNNPPCVS